MLYISVLFDMYLTLGVTYGAELAYLLKVC